MNFYDNPNMLFEAEIDYSKLLFIQSISLGSSIKEIKLLGDEDIYYEGESINEPLPIKFRSLLSSYGWLHFPNGTSFEIQKGSVIGIKLYKDSLGPLKNTSSKMITDRMGEPNIIESDIDTWVFDSVHNANIFCYPKIGINFHIDPFSNTIIEVRIYRPKNSVLKKIFNF